MNFYKRYPTAFQNKTLDLNFRQIGIYNLLLDYQYQSEGPIKDIRHAMEILRRIATPDPDVCSRTELRAVKFVLEKYFIHKDNGYWNPRALEEIEYVTNKRTQAQKAARIRHRDPKNGDIAVTLPRHSRDIAVTSPRHRRDTETSKSTEKELFPHADLDLDLDLDKKTIETSNTTSKPTTKNNNAPTAHFSKRQLQLIKKQPEIKTSNIAEVVPVDLWASFTQMRSKLRKPLTDHASELIWRKLSMFKEQGEDPVEILEQSIMNGWSGIFSMKGKSNGHTESFDERRSRTSAAAIKDIFGSHDGVVSPVHGTLPPKYK